MAFLVSGKIEFLCLQVLNHDLLFSVPYCFLMDHLINKTTCNVMVDHLQSRVMPWRQYASHVKVRGTLSKMDVWWMWVILTESDSYYARAPTLDGFTQLLFWIFDYSFWLFGYVFSLFDDRVKYSKFLLAVETWFLLLKIIFVTPNKVLNITNNQMSTPNMWIFWTNNGSNNQIFISIILIIRPRLAFVGSKNDLCLRFQKLKKNQNSKIKLGSAVIEVLQLVPVCPGGWTPATFKIFLLDINNQNDHFYNFFDKCSFKNADISKNGRFSPNFVNR